MNAGEGLTLLDLAIHAAKASRQANAVDRRTPEAAHGEGAWSSAEPDPCPPALSTPNAP